MLKKMLMASAVLAATSSVAFANGGTYAPIPVHTGNCYIGAAISRDVGVFQVEHDLRNAEVFSDGFPLSFIDLTHNHWDQGLGGVNGEIFAGYGWLFQDHWYLAGEIFGSVSSLKGEHHEDVIEQTFSDGRLTDRDVFLEDHLRFRVNHTFGISLIPGVKVTDSTLLYGRIGYVNSRIEVDETGFTSGLNFPLPGIFDLDRDYSRNRSGLQLGLGIETMITNNCSIRGEYDYNQYGSFTDSHHRHLVDPDFSFISFDLDDHVRVKPKIDQFKLAAIYHFYA